jgi:hypothetical protein
MIEAMACGTPVIAWRCGSVPEVIEDGVSGYIIDSIEEGVEAVHRVQWLDRRACREAFESRFDAARMAADYLNIYRRQVHAGPHPVAKTLRKPLKTHQSAHKIGHPLDRPRSLRPLSQFSGAVPAAAPPEIEPDEIEAGEIEAV